MEKHGVVAETSSVCRLQLHHAGTAECLKAPGGRSSVSLVCEVVRKSPPTLGDILPAALPCLLRPTLALHPLSESSESADAAYLSKSPW